MGHKYEMSISSDDVRVDGVTSKRVVFPPVCRCGHHYLNHVGRERVCTLPSCGCRGFLENRAN